ncbi:MAG: DEAD/DEAH box helicase [Candidatus Zipacnadales bacterium]
MDVSGFLREIANRRDYRQQMVHIHELPARQAQFAELSEPLHEVVRAVLSKQKIKQLYTHQVEAIEAARQGKNVIIVTGTASGKTLCYNIPVLETLLTEPRAKAIYLYPTKALAQDQLRVLNALKALDPTLPIEAGTYDGDTPPETRRKLRDEGNVILTNPDMLHAGILPNHARWSDFIAQLRYVVIDEIHSYRGIFGSNVGNVLRRLRRIASHYKAKPQFIGTSATIDNPQEHAEVLVGEPFTAVTNDGSPRGPKRFVLWNPPYIDERKVERRSPNFEAEKLMVDLILHGVPTICFVRARQTAEVLYRYIREELLEEDPRRAEMVRAYRGGYLAEERREIERLLFSGKLLGVTTTNALELGIDIGSLDAAILVGYPGSVASTWQQAGRAGRGDDEALVFLIAQNSPIDQYMMQHTEYFFGQAPERAVIEPANPYLLLGHLRCACQELPLGEADCQAFGEGAASVMELLEEDDQVYFQGGKWRWKGSHFPAGDVNLRNIGDNNYLIQDMTGGTPEIIGEVDELSAFTQLHTQAIYMHRGDPYFVEELNLREKIAYVRKGDYDYYTQAIDKTEIQIEGTDVDEPWRVSRACLGPVVVTTTVYMFRKIKFYSRESVGFGNIDLPPLPLETEALWIIPPGFALERVRQYGRIPEDGLLGVANAALGVLPIFVMCDPADVGSAVDSSNTGSPAIFIYDRYPKGLGFAEKTHERLEEIIQAALFLVEHCACEDGCPSCVGSPLPVFGPPDSDVDTRGKIPDKEAALCILHDLLEREPYVPRPVDPAKLERRLAALRTVSVMPEPEDKPDDDALRPRGKPLPQAVERKLRRRIQSLKRKPRH